MENVMIAILNPYDKVLTFMDNSAPDALHYYDDELHTYVKGSAATFGFSASAKHDDAQYLVEGNKLSFVYNGKDYYFNIMKVEKDEYKVTITAFSLHFELLNDTLDAYKASHAMTLNEYMKQFDAGKVITIGINEISTVSMVGDFSQETFLARMFALADLFDAEVEFVPVLSSNYSMDKLIMNIYREHDSKHQGMGKDRRDITLRYGKDVDGIKKTSDITELYTAIRPEGNDGLMLNKFAAEVLDDNGDVEFKTGYDSLDILAVQARDRFPSLRTRKDGYIRIYKKYDTSDQPTLWFSALHDLQEYCVPKVTYEIEGSFDTEIGDTVSVEDTEFNPPLYLSARVTEQVVSFTDPSRNKSTFSNIKELQSQISPELLKRMQALVDASKVYSCSIITDNGIVFKNGEGTTTLTASVMDGGSDLTDSLAIQWYKDGTAVATGKALEVSASEISDKAVYRFEALANGIVKGNYEVTVVNVSDGVDGRITRLNVSAPIVKKKPDGAYDPESLNFSVTLSDGYVSGITYELNVVFEGANVGVIQGVKAGETWTVDIPENTTGISCKAMVGTDAVDAIYIPVVDDGTSGTDGTSYRMQVNSLAVKRKTSGEFDPTTIIVTGFSQTGNNEQSTHYGNYEIEFDDSNAVGRGYSFYKEIPMGTQSIKCRMKTLSGTLLDELTIPIVDDGEPGEPGEPGNAGTDATAYKMLVNALAIGKTASGTYKQSTITVQGRKQTGTGAYSSYACRFKVETTTSSNLSSATWTSRYTSSSNVSSYTYTILSGITGIRVSMYLAGGTTTLLDQVIIPIVTDGADGSDGEDGADASLTPTLLASAKTLSSGSSFSVSSVKDLLLLEIANSSERSRHMEVFIKGVSATRYVHIPYDESTELFMTVTVTWSGSTATIKCTKFSTLGNWSSGTSQLCYVYTL